MSKKLTIFDRVESFLGAVPALLAARGNTDLLLVNIDRPNSEAFDPDNMPSEDHGKLCMRHLEGLGLLQIMSGSQLMGEDEDKLAGIAESSFNGSQKHPVDVCFEQKRFQADAVVIVTAGVVECKTQLFSTRRVLRHLPQADVYLLTCDCAKDRKVALAADERVVGKLAGIIFTSECKCIETQKKIEAAFIAAATTALN